ncbi:MAG TPA: riboflavin synthase [Longimicrobiales bacterium]
MFTGIVEEVGRLEAADRTERGLRIRIAARVVAEGLSIGDSVAVDGVCQTVVERTPTGFTVEAMAPTLSRTTFGELGVGGRVNLERAMALGARVGGHMVQGHVDAVGRVERVERHEEHVLVDVAIPEDVADVTVLHGSIAINGVSLTVNEIPADGVIQVALIPHTWEHTNLSDLRAGSGVNVEGDMIGKFVVEYLKRRGADAI